MLTCLYFIVFNHIINADFNKRRKEMCEFCNHIEKADTTSQMPLIGDKAPEFIANTTNGKVNFPADYAGKWVILFSHPADFTPVCTTEFMTFQSMLSEFQKFNTEVIGLSIGTLTGHLAWIHAIKNIEYKGWHDMNITFPIIDDMNMQIAKQYGMLHPNASDGKTVRAVFIIDPNGIIRTILYYPLTTGRNFEEIKRILIALQTADAFQIATPADWYPGDDVVVPAPSTTDDMIRRLNRRDKMLDVKAWFLTFKKLKASDIYIKLTTRPKSIKKKK